jgi:hypothetical protein
MRMRNDKDSGITVHWTTAQGSKTPQGIEEPKGAEMEQAFAMQAFS